MLARAFDDEDPVLRALAQTKDDGVPPGPDEEADCELAAAQIANGEGVPRAVLAAEIDARRLR